MQAFLKVGAWSLAGAIIGGTLMFLFLVAYDRLFEPSTDNTVRGFQAGQEILTGIGGAVVGLVLGAVLGVIRIRSGNLPRPTNQNEPR
jgi:hypothetical protein